MEIAVIIAIVAIIFIARTLKIVPQQNAWVVERLGKYDRTLTPGLSFVVPPSSASRFRGSRSMKLRERATCQFGATQLTPAAPFL